MRNFIYLTFLLLAAGLVSCRKDKVQQTIKQYDDSQIQAYIAAKGYTNMKRDTTGGDTSGIYYEVLAAGTGAPVDYPTYISYTYTMQSVDGKYSLPDTIATHNYTYLGAVSPSGLQLALHNLVKKMGTKLRVIVPSHLAYGINGSSTSQLPTTPSGATRVGGNQCLDYYINVVNNVSSYKDQSGQLITYPTDIDDYDEISIQKYMSANSVTGFTRINSGTYAGVYYLIRTPGTGTIPVTNTSVVNFDYRTQLLNGTVIEPASYSTTTGNVASNTTYTLSSTAGQIQGLREALMLGGYSGAEVTVIVPSRLAYGLYAQGSYPADSCLIIYITIDTVTN